MIDLLIARLKAQVPTLEKVEDAWELDNVIDDDLAMPAVYLYIAKESTRSSDTEYVVTQRLTVLVKLRILAMAEQLQDIKTAIRKALVGWNPDPAASWDNLELAGGVMMRITGGTADWEESYITWRPLRQVLGQPEI
jgi:hypothetical protein